MKKILLAAIVCCAFACNKNDELPTTEAATSLFPLTLGNEWHYKWKNSYSSGVDTFRIISDFSMTDINQAEQAGQITYKNKNLVIDHEWMRFDRGLNQHPMACTDPTTIGGLTIKEDYTLSVSPYFKKVDKDGLYFENLNNIGISYRYAYASLENINGYPAFKNHFYQLNLQGDTIGSEFFYIAEHIGIVRIVSKNMESNLVSYKFN